MRDVTVEIEGVRYGVALAVIWPLVRRSAKFGPYFWCAFLIVVVCGTLVGNLVGGWGSFIFGIFSWWVIGAPAKQADMERVLHLWAAEVADMEMSHG